MLGRRLLVGLAIATCVSLTIGAATLVSVPGVSASAASAARRRPRITVAFTGDFLATHATREAASRNAGGHGSDLGPMVRRLGTLTSSADLAICHLETPLAGRGVPLSDFPRYAVLRQLADAIRRAGYDGCWTASNHSLDHGSAGIRATLRKLDSLGIAHTGTARSAGEAARITRYRVGKAVLAHLSYTASFNGLEPDHAWRRTDSTSNGSSPGLVEPADRTPTSWCSACTGAPSTVTLRPPSRRPWLVDSRRRRRST
jgi:poly-gamma-glutamate synthesis protein (capsule biosynthesis protein)